MTFILWVVGVALEVALAFVAAFAILIWLDER